MKQQHIVSNLSPLDGLPLLELDERGPLKRIDPLAQVSKLSQFQDATWDYNDPADERFKAVSPHHLRISWAAFETRHGAQLAHQVKTLMYVRATHPAFGSTRFSPRTATAWATGVDAALRVIRVGNPIQDLTELTIDDIKKVAKALPTRVCLRPAMMALVHPDMRGYLTSVEFSFDSAQVAKVAWSTERNSEEDHYEPLSNALFGFLTSNSEDIVRQFLVAYGEPPLNPASGVKEVLGVPARWPQFFDMVADYFDHKTKRGQGASNAEAVLRDREFRLHYGVRKFEFQAFVNKAQDAAITFVLAFTGMRYSEFSLLKPGCVEKLGKHYVIRSTVTKAVSHNMPMDLDRWVATDAMRDAMRVLEIIARHTGSTYLIAPVRLLADKLRVERPLTAGSLRFRLIKYLALIDTKGVFKDWELHTHQFKSGLAHQLARMHVKLPYISMQLKHLSYAAQAFANDMPSSVTLGYGNIPKAVLDTATGAAAVRDAREELALGLYGEDKKFAGGGADAHKQRVDAFFQGQALFGPDRETYIRKRAREGIPIFVSGVGVCSKNLSDPKKLKENPPPCYGDLHCNPSECSNSIVPEHSRPALERRLEKSKADARASGDPLIREFHEGAVQRYTALLGQLTNGTPR